MQKHYEDALVDCESLPELACLISALWQHGQIMAARKMVHETPRTLDDDTAETQIIASGLVE